jgi:hypothetical protein
MQNSFEKILGCRIKVWVSLLWILWLQFLKVDANDYPQNVCRSVFLFAPLKYSSINIFPSFIATILVIFYRFVLQFFGLIFFSNINFLCWNLPIFSWFNQLNFNQFSSIFYYWNNNFIWPSAIMLPVKPRSVLNKSDFNFKLMFSSEVLLARIGKKSIPKKSSPSLH